MQTIMDYLPWLQHGGPLGYVLVSILSFAEAFVLTGWIVPGTILVILAGGFAAQGIFNFWILVLFASVGAMLGDGISHDTVFTDF